MVSIKINEDEITAVLDRLARHLTDMTPVMSEVGELLIDSTKQRFIKGVSPEGQTWAPKSQTTLDAYAARGDRVDFRPLFGPTKRLSSEINYQTTESRVEWGSNLIQAAVMHFGAGKGEFGTGANGQALPWGNIPARPFIGISDEDRGNIKATVYEWLEQVSKAKD
ncbi:MAG: phage virion morphogenesis protein [Amylibacter sp.]|nr:phage virion morphogenesis protein [Amylibacter sp.]